MTPVRRTLLTGAVVTTAILAACGGGAGDSGAMDTGYATDGDSGAPAPATSGNYTPTQPVDSTTGVAAPTGTGGVAGVRGAKSDDVTDTKKNPTP